MGENGTRQIEFDCTEILTEYPAAVIVCAVKRPGEDAPGEDAPEVIAAVDEAIKILKGEEQG